MSVYFVSKLLFDDEKIEIWNLNKMIEMTNKKIQEKFQTLLARSIVETYKLN